MLLLDTDILVDLLRAYPPAVAWLLSVQGETIALPGYVVLELLDGCSNRQETDRLLRLVTSYKVFWPSSEDCDWAIAEFAIRRLTHKLGILDVLIASCAVGLNLPLYTFNVKHFRAISGMKTVQPYSKGE